MTADPVDLLLSRLDRAREVAPGRWRACCPAHGSGNNPTALAITRGDTGAALLHCFGGCELEEVVHALGLDLADLFPPRPPGVCGSHSAPPVRHPFIPAQVFDIARNEVAVAAIICLDMHAGRQVSDEDWARLLAAHQRLDDIARSAYGRP